MWDSKLRGCDLVSLRFRDVHQGNVVSSRAIVMQRKTQRPVQFEITEATREAVAAWVARCALRSSSYLFPGRGDERHLSVRQNSRIVKVGMRRTTHCATTDPRVAAGLSPGRPRHLARPAGTLVRHPLARLMTF